MEIKRSALFVISICLILAIASLSLLAGCNKTSQAPTSASTSAVTQPTMTSAKTIELRFATQFAPQTWQCLPTEYFAKEAETRTNGRVKVTLFEGAALGAGNKYLGMIQQGAIEFASVSPIDYPDVFPMSDISNLPGLIPNTAVLGDLLANLYSRGYFDQELKGLKVMWFQPNQGSVLYTKKKITTLEDVKGLKIKSSGPVDNWLVQAAGGVPVAVQVPEIYTSLEKGIIDAQIATNNFFYENKMYEVTKFCLAEPLHFAHTMILMNDTVWNNLPPDIQITLDQLMDETRYHVYDKVRYNFDDLKAKGVEIDYLSPEEHARWQQVLMEYTNNWAKNMDSKGYKGTEIVNLAKYYAAGAS